MPLFSCVARRASFAAAAGISLAVSGSAFAQSLSTASTPTSIKKGAPTVKVAIVPTDPSGGGGSPPAPRGPSNNFCSNATPIGEGTFSFDTTVATNDGTASCGASAGSPDVWFAYSPSSNGSATVDACGLVSYDSVLSAHSACGGSELACNDDTCILQSRIQFPVSAGSTYLIRVSGYNGSVGSGSINVSLGPPCLFLHHAFATAEPEACGGSTNGGCNQPAGDPPQYTEISCDTTIAGYSWADGNMRDTDWYRIDALPGTPVTVTLQAAFGAVLFAFDEACPPTVTNFTDANCFRDGILEFIANGPTVVFVSTGSLGGAVFNGLPCGTASTNGYNLSILFGRRCPAPCPCDWNASGNLNSQDFFDFLVSFFGGTADFNNDGQTNSQDFFDFLVCFFNGCAASSQPYLINLTHTGTINGTDFVATGHGTADPASGVVLVRWEQNVQVPGYDPLRSIVTLGGTGGGGTCCRTVSSAQNLLDIANGNWDFVAVIPDAITTIGSVRTAGNVIDVQYHSTGTMVGGPVLRLRGTAFDQTPGPVGSNFMDERQVVVMEDPFGEFLAVIKDVHITLPPGAALAQPQVRELNSDHLYKYSYDALDRLIVVMRYESVATPAEEIANRCRYTINHVIGGAGCNRCQTNPNGDVICLTPCTSRNSCLPSLNFKGRCEDPVGGGQCTYEYFVRSCVDPCR